MEFQRWQAGVLNTHTKSPATKIHPGSRKTVGGKAEGVEGSAFIVYKQGNAGGVLLWGSRWGRLPIKRLWQCVKGGFVSLEDHFSPSLKTSNCHFVAANIGSETG